MMTKKPEWATDTAWDDFFQSGFLLVADFVASLPEDERVWIENHPERMIEIANHMDFQLLARLEGLREHAIYQISKDRTLKK